MFERLKAKINERRWLREKEEYSVSEKGKSFILYCIRILNGEDNYIEAYEKTINIIMDEMRSVIGTDEEIREDNIRRAAAAQGIAILLAYCEDSEIDSYIQNIHSEPYRMLVQITMDRERHYS